MLRYIYLFIAAAVFPVLAVEIECTQRHIPRVEQMPNIPEPFLMRDWKKVAADYDKLVFDFDRKGEYLPLIWLDETKFNTDMVGFGMPSYVGHPGMTGGSGHEAINCMGAVLGASLVGIDKSSQSGRNYVAMCENYFSVRNKQDMFFDTTSAVSGNTFWYEIYPNMLMFKIAEKYPDQTRLKELIDKVGQQWYKACMVVKEGEGEDCFANFNYTSFDFAAMKPVDNGRWIEPDAAAGAAFMQYLSYIRSGDEKYLEAADMCMRFLDAKQENPFYEVIMPAGAYTAARMNAELGRNYDIDKFINWCFGPSDARYGWGIIAQRWGGYDCHGLVGSLVDGGGYVFAMNTFVTAEAFVPMVRYDDRYARAIGKWVLNAANAARLFYSNGLPDENQTCEDWTKKYDPDACLTYEGLRKSWKGAAPYAMGDPLVHGWAKTDLALYGSSYVGFLGGLISPTNDAKIFRFDCLKTDYFHGKAYPTFLYFNPYTKSKKVEVQLDEGKFDLYDAVSNKFLKKNAKGKTSFTIPADNAVLLVVVPAKGRIDFNENKTLVNDVVIDYNNCRVPLKEPEVVQIKKKEVSASDQSIVVSSPMAKIVVDGSGGEWPKNMDSIKMKAAGSGRLQCNISFAWDNDYLYILISEVAGDTIKKEANSADEYAAEPWSYDGVSLFIDIDNSNNRESVGDFNLWFGFDSTGKAGLYCARSYVPSALSKDYMSKSAVAAGGSFENGDRVIEAAVRWTDIAAPLAKQRQPEGDLLAAVRSGFRFGCEPLLVDDGYKNQSFFGGIAQPAGSDSNSHDILLAD